MRTRDESIKTVQAAIEDQVNQYEKVGDGEYLAEIAVDALVTQGGQPDIDPGAMMLADVAYIETFGSTHERVKAAVWAYEWAKLNPHMIGSMHATPSVNDLRAALKQRNKS